MKNHKRGRVCVWLFSWTPLAPNLEFRTPNAVANPFFRGSRRAWGSHLEKPDAAILKAVSWPSFFPSLKPVLSACSLSRSPEESGGLDSGSPGGSPSVYGSHTSLSSAEGLGKKPEREAKPAPQQTTGEKGEAISQFELNYGSRFLDRISNVWDAILAVAL